MAARDLLISTLATIAAGAAAGAVGLVLDWSDGALGAAIIFAGLAGLVGHDVVSARSSHKHGPRPRETH